MKYAGTLLVGVLGLGAASGVRQGRPIDGRWTLLGAPISYDFRRLREDDDVSDELIMAVVRRHP